MVILVRRRRNKAVVRFAAGADGGKALSSATIKSEYDTVDFEMMALNPGLQLDSRELLRSQIKLGAKLGSGAFGEVFCGTMTIEVG